MALSRWDPVWVDVPSRLPPRVRRWLDSELVGDAWMRIEEREDTDALVVRAELPGVDPEKDVDVQLADGMLSVTVKRHERKGGQGSSTFRSEFHYGVFNRSVSVPAGADAAAVSATYHDGILEVRIPWPPQGAERPAPMRIPVQRC